MQLTLSWPIDLRLTVASHGWVHLDPWRWDDDAGVLSRPERVGDRLGTVAVSQTAPITLDIRTTGLSDDALPEVARRVGRWVSAEWDPALAIDALQRDFAEEVVMIGRGAGRLLRCSTFYEDFIKTLLTVNTSWAGTCRMNAALVSEPGGGAFPTPGRMIDYGEDRLRTIAKLGFRAPTAIISTQRMLEDGIIDADGHALAEEGIGHDYLIALKGIGPYAAAHCRMLLHDFSRIPVDSVVVAHLREKHNTTPAEFIAAHAACGAYLGLGYRLLRLREKFQVARVETAGSGY
jgi:N-glycosylase/DNA lyase